MDMRASILFLIKTNKILTQYSFDNKYFRGAAFILALKDIQYAAVALVRVETNAN